MAWVDFEQDEIGLALIIFPKPKEGLLDACLPVSFGYVPVSIAFVCCNTKNQSADDLYRLQNHLNSEKSLIIQPYLSDSFNVKASPKNLLPYGFQKQSILPVMISETATLAELQKHFAGFPIRYILGSKLESGIFNPQAYHGVLDSLAFHKHSTFDDVAKSHTCSLTPTSAKSINSISYPRARL